MAKTYRPYVPEQDLLLPPSLRDWLPEDHLAFFVSDLIDQLDLSAITSGVRGRGAGLPAVSPGDADEGAGVRLLRRRLLVAQDPAAAGRGRGVPRAGGGQRAGLPHDRRLSQDGI